MERLRRRGGRERRDGVTMDGPTAPQDPAAAIGAGRDGVVEPAAVAPEAVDDAGAAGHRPDLPAYMHAVAQAPARRTEDSLAKPALICGIAGVVFALSAGFAVVLGVMSLRRSRREGTSGRGFALAGVALGVVWIAVFAGVGLAAWHASRQPAEVAVGPGGLAVGACGVVGSDGTFQGVPCDQPHTVEVVANFELPDGPYPGRAELRTQADALCRAKVEPYLEHAPVGERWSVGLAGPATATDWDVSRYVSCWLESAHPRSGPWLSPGA